MYLGDLPHQSSLIADIDEMVIDQVVKGRHQCNEVEGVSCFVRHLVDDVKPHQEPLSDLFTWRRTNDVQTNSFHP